MHRHALLPCVPLLPSATPEADDAMPSLEDLLCSLELPEALWDIEAHSPVSPLSSLGSNSSLCVDPSPEPAAALKPLPPGGPTDPDPSATAKATATAHRPRHPRAPSTDPPAAPKVPPAPPSPPSNKPPSRSRRNPPTHHQEPQGTLMAAMYGDGSRYKTHLCAEWLVNSCPRGEHCPAAHGASELRSEADNRMAVAFLARLRRRPRRERPPN